MIRRGFGEREFGRHVSSTFVPIYVIAVSGHRRTSILVPNDPSVASQPKQTAVIFAQVLRLTWPRRRSQFVRRKNDQISQQCRGVDLLWTLCFVFNGSLIVFTWGESCWLYNSIQIGTSSIGEIHREIGRDEKEMEKFMAKRRVMRHGTGSFCSTLPHSTRKTKAQCFTAQERPSSRTKRRSHSTLIIVDVCMSVNFLMHRCPGTMLHT